MDNTMTRNTVDLSHDDGVFKLSVRSNNYIVTSNGELHVFLDRGELATIHFQSSAALLDNDIQTGAVDVDDL